ncbi:uracil-DNA glycosylase family protein [Winogradskyella sp. DF17]|jgi:G:T/U-mismatch repair DNA glycosylase|uniref:Uracil-DNA glycosylase family protein n=1 Tax=Winogradskyella pelagia TaxID=2819984 RepID=A0ABS3T4N6_9FLAO|nr:uracil-DNA glycosylase family protein [Winogradskyella sp. DF17]MBO3117719.1 uracil-DNA glycosylase family protein [Winogradskyella sp. DF17]
MFLHKHPFPPFIPKDANKLIVGTLPPPRFSTGQLKPDDVNFCYGSRDGQLWPILDAIFAVGFLYDNSDEAIMQRKQFLISKGIGICDIVASCERKKVDASDAGMRNVQLRNLLGYLKDHSNIDTILFTGGNSKNGPEYFFRRHIKSFGLKLKLLSNAIPRIHQLELSNRKITTVSLTAPSGSANRAVGSMAVYKQLKATCPKFNTFDFRVMQYESYFIKKA